MALGWGYVKHYALRFKNELNTLHIVSAFLLLFSVFVLKEKLAAIILIGFLYLVDIVFDIFLKFTLRPIYRTFPAGIELVTFNTVIAGMALGPIVGIFCGLLFGLTYYGIVFNFKSMYQAINIPAYGLIGYLAGAMAFTDIASFGMLLSAIYGVLTTFLVFLIFGGKLFKCLIFLSTYLLFNYWLFSNLSPIILNIIG